MTGSASADPVVVIGGGALGSAVAHFLTLLRPGCPVIVIERDGSYRCASSALSASSIRQQFSCAINRALSRFGIEFLGGARSGEIEAIHMSKSPSPSMTMRKMALR